jgi:hypothetical protein
MGLIAAGGSNQALPQRAPCPVRIPPHTGPFFLGASAYPPLTAAPRLTQLPIFKYNQIVVKEGFLPVFECIRLTLNLIRLIFEQNYTRQKSNPLVMFQDCHRRSVEAEMAARVNNKSEIETEKSHLSNQDLRLMLVMCTELVNLCAKLTGRIDPAAVAMLAYVRDDIASENNLGLQ